MELDDLNIGDTVKIDDPWFYPATGLVLEKMHTPHHAVRVQILSTDDERHSNWVGKETWVLPGNLSKTD